jgi:hypothetical protein
MEFQAYIQKIYSNNGMLKWNLRIGIQAVFFIGWARFPVETFVETRGLWI